jgi:uncharacterized protein (DUF608 family)
VGGRCDSKNRLETRHWRAPLANPGTRKPALTDLIDDGYWQGSPVGGLGSGTFSRTYRGDFSRWHLKVGIHKCETVYANQSAIYGGGAFWGRPVGGDPKSPPMFSFLECFDYPYYSTLDVRFSGSMPLVKFWPDLDKQEMRTFAETIMRSEPEKLIWNWKTKQDHKPAFRTRKSKGAVPHDLGAPTAAGSGWQPCATPRRSPEP